MRRLGICLCLCLVIRGSAWANEPISDLVWPEGTKVHPLPSGLRLNGIPLTVVMARMPLTMEAALEYLADRLGEGLLMRPHRGGWLLSPGPDADWVMRLMADGDAAVTASLSALPLGAISVRAAPSRDWTPAGGELRLGFEQGDALATAFSVHTYPGVSVAELSRRMQRRLVEQGWEGAAHGPIHDWTRARERLYAVVVAHAADSAIVAWHSGARIDVFEEAITP